MIAEDVASKPLDPVYESTKKIFDSYGYECISYEDKKYVAVKSKGGRWFSFYPKNSKWSAGSTLYWSNGAVDFIERFLKKNDVAMESLPDQLEHIVPAGIKVSLEELINFLFEEFEEGKTANAVYHEIRVELLKQHKVV